MSKRGAGERDGFAASQGNMRKARVEARRVDAIQLLMAAARARNNQPAPQPHQLAGDGGTAAAAATAAGGGQPPASANAVAAVAPLPGLAAAAAAAAGGAAAPCTHCGTVLPISAGSCSLRQCCACLDVFCSLCSVLDYEEREDRVFCLNCLEDQACAARCSRGAPATPGGPGRGGVATGSLSLALSLPLSGTAGRWGALEGLAGRGDPAARSPFPCSRTPAAAQPGSRTPGSALYSSRSHRGFSALLSFGGGAGA